MFYAPLYERLPDLARTETRSVTIKGHPLLPDGEYGLIEAYCNEPGCDCRRVMFNIFTPASASALAVIAYGWESAAFYARWFGQYDMDIIRQMQGPILNPGSPQSQVAPGLLLLVQEMLRDEAYVARLKRHYKLFKQAVNEAADYTSPKRLRRQTPKPKKRRR
jgi:hypothetical protein